jgi:hypothetical protein
MKINSDWVIYYLRSHGFCKESKNAQLGKIVKRILEGMDCPLVPEGVAKQSPLYKEMHAELAKLDFARTGMVYEIELDRLPSFFRNLANELKIEIS